MNNFIRVQQFKRFHNILMKNAVQNYIPWYIPIVQNNKAIEGRIIYNRSPSISCCKERWQWIDSKWKCPKCKKTRGSWKQSWARLNFQECIQTIMRGYNIGLAARNNDPLCIIDIDNFQYYHELKPTLTDRSRKRCGAHAFYWYKNEAIRNNPTEDSGEIRSQDQYVLIPGSYVPTTKEEIDKEFKEGHIEKDMVETIMNDPYIGYYTVEKELEVSTITYEELPSIFKVEKKMVNITPRKKVVIDGNHSALFDLKISHLVSISPDIRTKHPLHDSDTSMNFSVSGDLAHCWRHNVCLNAIQYLVVKSGYMSCCDAGTGHKDKDGYSKPSCIIGNDGAIFYAWLQAKKDRLIPKNDPIPVSAIRYIAQKNFFPIYIDNYIPKKTFRKCIELLERGEW